MTVIVVKVKPRSRASRLEPLADGSYVATLKSAPVDGQANAELVALVAERFGVARSEVTIKTGAGARIKRVVIGGG